MLFADEILLVDSFSKDRTVEIAAKYPVTVLQREYFGSAAQKNWALDRVQNDWVLIIDADERVPEALAREILILLATAPAANGFYIRRENVFIDKVIRHSGWSTDKVVRLFRRDKGRYPNRRVHADLEIEGAVPVLQEPLPALHLPQLRPVLPEVPELRRSGARRRPSATAARRASSSSSSAPGGGSCAPTSCRAASSTAPTASSLCSLQAFGVFLKYARLWEYRIRAARGEDLALPAFDDDESTWKRPEENGD